MKKRCYALAGAFCVLSFCSGFSDSAEIAKELPEAPAFFPIAIPDIVSHPAFSSPNNASDITIPSSLTEEKRDSHFFQTQVMAAREKGAVSFSPASIEKSVFSKIELGTVPNSSIVLGKKKSSLLSRLSRAIKNKISTGVLFDGRSGSGGMSIIARKPWEPLDIPKDVSLGDNLNVFHSKKKKDGLIQNFTGRSIQKFLDFFEPSPILIEADPNDEISIEKALRKLIDADPARYGVPSSDLITTYVTRHAGAEGRANTLHAYFRQKKTILSTDGSRLNLPVWGSYLAATIKVIHGKPYLVAVQFDLEKGVQLKGSRALRDQELESRVRRQVSLDPEMTLRFIGRAVIDHEGNWQAVNLYRKNGLPVTIAADLLSGDVFFWESDAEIGGLNEPNPVSQKRKNLRARSAARAPPLRFRGETLVEVSGQILGRVEMDDLRPGGKIILSPQPLPYLNFTIGGQEYRTDENGRFKVSIDPSDPSQKKIKAKLSGKFTEVVNEAGESIEMSETVSSGEDNTFIVNPEGADPLIVNQVNAYIADSRHRQWARHNLNFDSRLDYRTVIRVNTNQHGNAWYSSESGDIHADRENEKFSDTGRPGILFHEMTHKIDDRIHNPPANFFTGLWERLRSYFAYGHDVEVFHQAAAIIPNEGLSEGWGDIFSMFLLDASFVGEGFFKQETPSWIRDGNNDYQYNPNDEIHQRGLAWMGFAWRLRRSLIESLGPQVGAAAAESLIVPVMLAYVPDIPSAMAHVLLNAMDPSGVIHYESHIRSAARAHGVELPPWAYPGT